MRRLIQAMLIASSMLLAGLGVWPASAQTTSCQLAPVFVLLRDQAGRDRVGECSGPPIRNEAGDLTQPTTHGILTLRSADQVVAFSDGQTTWLYGPNGLESRPSGSRLAWEASGSSHTGSATSGGGSTSTATYAAATPTPTLVTPTPTPYMPSATSFNATPTPTMYAGSAYTGSATGP